MRFNTKNIKVASVHFVDPKKGVLVGCGGSEGKMIYNCPKVLLYYHEDKVINVFNPDDETMIIKRSTLSDHKYSIVRGEMLTDPGVCYIESSNTLTLGLMEDFCTIEDIENNILTSCEFFLERKDIVLSRMKKLDEELSCDKISKKTYQDKMMNLLYLQHEDRKKQEAFYKLIEGFKSETKLQYNK